MLITKSGFKAFNEYDLMQTLESQMESIKDSIRAKLKASLPEDIDQFVNEYIEANTLKKLEIKKTELYMDEPASVMIPAESFPGDFNVRRGNSYEKDVLTFHLPYQGDKTLLHSVPSSRVLWTEEIVVENSTIVFQLINFRDDKDHIDQAVERLVEFLINQSKNVNEQVDTFNSNLEPAIRTIIDEEISSLKNKEDFVKSLGYEVKQTSEENGHIAGKELEIEAERNIKQYDVFISHSSSDKDYVDKLADKLLEAGIEVWYDSFALKWGDDIRTSIDKGLQNSKFGLVVLSKDFLRGRKWTDYELNGFVSVERPDRKFVLPLWHEVTVEEVRKYSPTLADKTSLHSGQEDEIIKELKRLLDEDPE